MIDAATYKLIHSVPEHLTDRQLGDDSIEVEANPKDEGFVIRLPATAKAFHMQDKKWGKSGSTPLPIWCV